MKYSAVKFLSLVALFLVVGCAAPVDFVSTVDDLPSSTASDAKPVTTYTGKAYLAGTLNGDLKEELAAAFTFTAYDGSGTDAPIFIPGDQMNSLTDRQKAGIIAAYQAKQAIILVNTNLDQITLLHTLLSDTDLAFTMPDGISTAEIYGVDLDTGDHMFQWVQYPPSAEVVQVDPDISADQQDRVGDLVKWLQANDHRLTEIAAAAAAANKTAKGDAPNLTQLASAFVNQSNFTCFGNRYQITHFVYTCHSLTTNDDWFFIQQYCVFNASGGYKGRIPWYKGGGGDAAYWYLDKINIDTYMKGYDTQPSLVGMIQSTPATSNKETQITSGVDFNIGGELSLDMNGPAGKISGGVTIHNSTMINIKDCNEVNKSLDRGSNVHWLYTFKRCDSVAYIGYAGLTDPPDLAVNTFQPLNQWIWRMNPALRQANAPMQVKLDVGLVGSTGMWDFLWVAHPFHRETGGGSWTFDVKIPYPPIK